MVPGLGLTVMSHAKLTFYMEIDQLMFVNSSSHAIQLDLQTMAVSVTCMDREKLRHLDENLTMTKPSGRLAHLWLHKTTIVEPSPCIFL